jgi:hypothetical protein
MPIKIDGKIYKTPDDSGERGLTMGEQLMIEREFKRPLEKLFANVNISPKAFKSLSEERREAIEVEQRQVFAIMVWVARRRAGENVSFIEANDFETDKFEFLEDDADPLAKSPAESTTE